ncbi:MAG: hypothetical protein RML40_05310 [Bacteroidota bacterium]|nr:hypothetical protein [Candidatus Kapabacteria bacterium]MDW8219931.1 hypothetical protein [Bacteroidota bacterium]
MIALQCNAHRAALMLLAVSESARKLHTAQNIIPLRIAIRDTKLFLEEAKRYWEQR